MKFNRLSRCASFACVFGLMAAARAMSSDIGIECKTCRYPTEVSVSLCGGVYMEHGLVLTAAASHRRQ